LQRAIGWGSRRRLEVQGELQAQAGRGNQAHNQWGAARRWVGERDFGLRCREAAGAGVAQNTHAIIGVAARCWGIQACGSGNNQGAAAGRRLQCAQTSRLGLRAGRLGH